MIPKRLPPFVPSTTRRDGEQEGRGDGTGGAGPGGAGPGGYDQGGRGSLHQLANGESPASPLMEVIRQTEVLLFESLVIR